MAAVAVIVVLATAGCNLSTKGFDDGVIQTNGHLPLDRRPTLEEFHAQLWPLGHEFMRQLEAATGVTIAVDAGSTGWVQSCNVNQGWMEWSSHYDTAPIDPAVAERVGARVLSADYPAFSLDDRAPGETYLYWTNPDLGSGLTLTIRAGDQSFLSWSSGCALSSVYPPPYTKPWPSGLPSPPTPLPDPEAPTVTASPLPSSPAARPTPTSSPS